MLISQVKKCTLRCNRKAFVIIILGLSINKIYNKLIVGLCLGIFRHYPVMRVGRKSFKGFHPCQNTIRRLNKVKYFYFIKGKCVCYNDNVHSPILSTENFIKCIGPWIMDKLASPALLWRLHFWLKKHVNDLSKDLRWYTKFNNSILNTVAQFDGQTSIDREFLHFSSINGFEPF